MDSPHPWKNGNAFDFDYEIRPLGQAMSTESAEDRWGDPKLSKTLEKHKKYWRGHSFGLNQRTNDLSVLDAQLKEYQNLPAIQGFRPKNNFHGGGGGVKRKTYGWGSVASKDDGDDDDAEEEDPNVRHMMGGGGSWSPCVMIVMKTPGRNENISGKVLDRSGFPGEIAVAAKKVITQSGRAQEIHVAYVAPFYPNGEWKGDIPDRIADLFSFYFRLRLIICRPKVILAVGGYMAKFLIARCLVRSLKYVERPEFNYPFEIRLKAPGSKAARGGGFKFLIFHLVHPFLTKSGISGSNGERLEKYKKAYADGFELLYRQLCVGKRKLNAFSMLMGTGTAAAESRPPNYNVLLSQNKRIMLAISGRPKRKEEITFLVLKHRIGLVISLTLNPLPQGWIKGLGCEMVHIPVTPGNPPSISEMLNVYRTMVAKGWKKRKGVLIHCQHGVDRSGMAGGVIMMQTLHTNPTDLLPIIRKASEDPTFLCKAYHHEFLTQMYRHFHPTATTKIQKRQRSEKKKPQLSHKKLRM